MELRRVRAVCRRVGLESRYPVVDVFGADQLGEIVVGLYKAGISLYRELEELACDPEISAIVLV